jgi:hypothetical protein
MSDTTVQEAPAQPAQVEQTVAETKGATNTTMSDFAKRLAAKQTAPVQFQAPVEVKVEAKAEPAPVNEEAKKPAEVEALVTEEAQATEETEAETEEVLSPEAHSLDPKLQATINKRIGKEVAKTKREIAARVAAEVERDQLKAQLAEKSEAVPEVVPVPANVPLADITTMEQLNQYRENLANDIVEAEMMLYSEFPPEGKQTKWGHITKDALIAALTQAKKDERTAIPAREKFLNTRSQSSQTAQEKFPFLKDPTHPGYQMAKQALRDNPVLRSYPNSEYLVGMMVKGQLAMLAEEGTKQEPKAAKPRPKPTGGQADITSDASITRAPTGTMNSQALQAERANATGGKKSLNSKDFAKLLIANAKFRNSQ